MLAYFYRGVEHVIRVIAVSGKTSIDELWLVRSIDKYGETAWQGHLLIPYTEKDLDKLRA